MAEVAENRPVQRGEGRNGNRTRNRRLIALCGLLVGLGGTKKSPAGAGLRLFGKPNSAHRAFWAPPAVGIDEGRRQSVIERPEAERFGPGRQHEIAS